MQDAALPVCHARLNGPCVLYLQTRTPPLEPNPSFKFRMLPWVTDRLAWRSIRNKGWCLLLELGGIHVHIHSSWRSVAKGAGCPVNEVSSLVSSTVFFCSTVSETGGSRQNALSYYDILLLDCVGHDIRIYMAGRISLAAAVYHKLRRQINSTEVIDVLLAVQCDSSSECSITRLWLLYQVEESRCRQCI